MSDPIREALQRVADIIECVHDPYNYSNVHIVGALHGIEEEVSDALRILDTQGRAVRDLPKPALEAIAAILLQGFDVDGDNISWDHQDISNRAFCMLRSYGLFGRE